MSFIEAKSDQKENAPRLDILIVLAGGFCWYINRILLCSCDPQTLKCNESNVHRELCFLNNPASYCGKYMMSKYIMRRW